MTWKSININKQNIKVETCRSVLIKMPRNSDYNDYTFWHPAKLIRDNENSNTVSMYYTDEFVFKLSKKGKGKYNKYETISEKNLSSYELIEAFNTMTENNTKKYEYETHKPIKVEINEIKIPEELKDE